MNSTFYLYFMLFSTLIANAITFILVSYFKRKGRNLADKEDLKELKMDLEVFKNELTKENIQLKTDLDLIAKRQTDLMSDERNALLNFYDRIHSYLELSKFNPGYSTVKTVMDKLTEQEKLLLDELKVLNLNLSRISLFISDIPIYRISHELTSQITLHREKYNVLLNTLIKDIDGEKPVVGDEDQYKPIVGTALIKIMGLHQSLINETKDNLQKLRDEIRRYLKGLPPTTF